MKIRETWAYCLIAASDLCRAFPYSGGVSLSFLLDIVVFCGRVVKFQGQSSSGYQNSVESLMFSFQLFQIGNYV